MRVLPLVLALGGCITPTDSGSGWSGSGGGWTGPGGGGVTGCEQDSECGGSVCARDGECLPATSVRWVHVNWTLHGQPAGGAICQSSPDLLIEFYSDGGTDQLGYAPVPCAAGKFTVDKLPTWYTRVELGRDGDVGTSAPIDRTTGDATIDLPY